MLACCDVTTLSRICHKVLLCPIMENITHNATVPHPLCYMYLQTPKTCDFPPDLIQSRRRTLREALTQLQCSHYGNVPFFMRMPKTMAFVSYTPQVIMRLGLLLWWGINWHKAESWVLQATLIMNVCSMALCNYARMSIWNCMILCNYPGMRVWICMVLCNGTSLIVWTGNQCKKWD